SAPRAGCIAQLVEQLTLNQRVAGSSPAAPTIKSNTHQTAEKYLGKISVPYPQIGRTFGAAHMPARVLVVDDVPLNVELLTAKLVEYENCVVSKAYDGFQTLAKIKSEKPDIVLLNVDDAEARRI